MKKFFKDYYLFEIILGLIFGYFAIQKVDLPPFDEALYQYLAMNSPYLNSSWGPFYSLYLSLFFRFTNDPITVHYVNLFLLSFVMLPFAVLFLSRSLGFDRKMQSIVFAAVLTSASNFPIDPKVQVFNFVCITFLALIVIKNKNLILTTLLVSLSPLLVYVRQDNHIYVLFFFLFLFYCYRHIKNKRDLFKNLIVFAVGLFCCFITFKSIGNPFGYGRTWMAFLDHHAVVSFEYYKNCDSIAACRNVIFSGIEGFQDLILTKPELLIEHLLKNVETIPKVLTYSAKVQPIFGDAYLPVLLFIVLAVFFATNLSLSVAPKALYIFIFIGILKSLSTSIIMSPFTKYLLEIVYIMPLVLIFIIYGVKKIIIFKEFKLPAVFFMGLISITFLQGLDQTRQFGFRSGELEVVTKMKELNLPNPAKLKIFSALAAGFYYNGSTENAVFGDLDSFLQGSSKSKTINDFLDEKKIDIVAISPSLHNASKHREFASELNKFISDKGRPNFVMKFSKGKSFIFIRNHLQQSSPDRLDF